MANKRIIDLTEIQNIAEDDYVILDSNTSGTRKILASNIGGVNYSTTEQDTGLKWIDGKPIYQRTFVEHLNSISTGWNRLYTTDWYSLANKVVINSFAFYERYNRTYTGFLMQNYNDDSSPDFYSPFALNEDGNFKVTVYYTKYN